MANKKIIRSYFADYFIGRDRLVTLPPCSYANLTVYLGV